MARRTVVAVLGEKGGSLFVEPALAPGAAVVAEGRGLLEDGDLVVSKELGGGWEAEGTGPDGGRPTLARERP